MNDTFGVGCVERVRNLDSERQNQLGFERMPRNSVFQGQPIQKLHGL